MGGFVAAEADALQQDVEGTRSALASVSWELLRADGSVASGWRESYNLLRSDQGWRVFASTDHTG